MANVVVSRIVMEEIAVVTDAEVVVVLVIMVHAMTRQVNVCALPIVRAKFVVLMVVVVLVVVAVVLILVM